MVLFLLTHPAMRTGAHRTLLVIMVLAATSALAEDWAPLREPEVLPHAAHGLFTGDKWRFKHEGMLLDFGLRTLADVVSIPTGIPWWTPEEWIAFGGVVGSTVALSAGTPSIDVTFQNFLETQLLGPGHPKIWGPAGDLLIWGVGCGATFLTLLLHGLITKNLFTTQMVLFMLEAVIVGQVYHNLIKLLLGRSGPQNPAQEGHYWGPTEGIRFYPEGTPSGHMLGMYAMLSVVMHMIDHPIAYVTLNLFALAFGASLIGDNYHWLSDVTFGGAIGFCVGRWIVRHRSTLFVYGTDEKTKQPAVSADLMPIIIPGAGVGVGIGGTFF